MKKPLVRDSNDLIKEWDFNKNAKDGLFPENVTTGSGKRAWWICPNGHSYDSTIANREKHGCPYCSNRKILIGFNDLATSFPDIAAEWHPSRNGKLKPWQVFPKSREKVWWQCARCGWEWQAYVYSRTGGGTNCPHCSSNKTSFPEQAVYFFVKKSFPDATSRDLSLGFEIDIFIPSMNVGIEYDGSLYHNQRKDGKKDDLCVKKGIRLYRIREYGLKSTKSAINIIRVDNSESSLETSIKKLLHSLGVPNPSYVSIDIYRTEILNQYFEAETDGNVSDLFPTLADEWHPVKNGNLTPNRCKASSGRKVWWICSKCGGEYRAIVAQRTKGHGCPYCSGHKALPGKTDLQTEYPKLAAEWHPTRNGSLTPDTVKPNSNKKAWWICPVCKNEWEAVICSRTRGNGCPFCAGQRVIPGKNDLQTLNPKLAAEWHPTKNGKYSPRDYMVSSGKKVWWLCPKCHNEWQATIASRNEGRGCIVCGVEKAAHAKMLPVVQLTLDNNVVAKYESIKAAKEATGATSISACCKGQRKTSGGFRWKFDNSE